jgi:hypothetical protein
VDDVATVAEIYLGYEAFVLCRHFLCMGGGGGGGGEQLYLYRSRQDPPKVLIIADAQKVT